MLLNKVKENLKKAGYDGSLLKANDLLLAIDSNGKIMNNRYGEPEAIICNFELIWKISDTADAPSAPLSDEQSAECTRRSPSLLPRNQASGW
jgi:hypothetical protein